MVEDAAHNIVKLLTVLRVVTAWLYFSVKGFATSSQSRKSQFFEDYGSFFLDVKRLVDRHPGA